MDGWRILIGKKKLFLRRKKFCSSLLMCSQLTMTWLTVNLNQTNQKVKILPIFEFHRWRFTRQKSLALNVCQEAETIPFDLGGMRRRERTRRNYTQESE